MKFYCVRYKRQRFNELSSEWKDTDFKNQKIVVIAESPDEAIEKINQCLSNVETDNYRAVPMSAIKECIGLNFRSEFESTLWVDAIY